MVRSVCTPLAACLVLLVLRTPVHAEVRSVGPGKTFAAPWAAFASAADGDTIEIDAAGSYVGAPSGGSASDGGRPTSSDRGASGSPAVRSHDSGGCSSTPTPNSQIWGSFMMLMLAAVALRRRFK